MSKGYIVIAQNNASVDYLQQAYALALNLKLTQSSVNNLTVCVDAETKKKITNKHKQVFDYIVDIPWQDDAQGEDWKINNKWKYLHMTPYDETVVLDTFLLAGFPLAIRGLLLHGLEYAYQACPQYAQLICLFYLLSAQGFCPSFQFFLQHNCGLLCFLPTLF